MCFSNFGLSDMGRRVSTCSTHHRFLVFGLDWDGAAAAPNSVIRQTLIGLKTRVKWYHSNVVNFGANLHIFFGLLVSMSEALVGIDQNRSKNHLRLFSIFFRHLPPFPESPLPQIYYRLQYTYRVMRRGLVFTHARTRYNACLNMVCASIREAS